jgi:hypothetical protein
MTTCPKLCDPPNKIGLLHKLNWTKSSPLNAETLMSLDNQVTAYKENSTNSNSTPESVRILSFTVWNKATLHCSHTKETPKNKCRRHKPFTLTCIKKRRNCNSNWNFFRQIIQRFKPPQETATNHLTRRSKWIIALQCVATTKTWEPDRNYSKRAATRRLKLAYLSKIHLSRVKLSLSKRRH